MGLDKLQNLGTEEETEVEWEVRSSPSPSRMGEGDE